MQQDVARHAAEDDALHAVEAARTGHDEVDAPAARGSNDLVRRISGQHRRGGRNASLGKSLRHVLGELAVSVEQLLPVLGEVVVAERVETSHELEGWLRRRGDAEGLGCDTAEDTPCAEEVGNRPRNDFPERVTFLVDTYDTLTGVSRAIEVIRQRRLAGQLAIRLDSGDLLELSVASRGLLDEAGLPKVQIVASGNLDEYEIERLVQRSAPIDAYGVGTRMGVSADAPYLDSVYKLVAYDGRPVMKLSPGKATQPGAKQVCRTAAPKSIGPDLLASDQERAPSGMVPLLVPVMEGGRRLDPRSDSVAAARAHLDAALGRLPAQALRLVGPKPVAVEISPTLQSLATRVRSGVR